jgi:putative FmdB family regulatory protein
MPLYDYDCAACGRRFEVIHGVHADGPTTCPLCGKGPVRKAITAPAVHYKGSGWAKKERRATSSPGASKASGDGSSSSETDGSASSNGTSKGDSESTSETTPATGAKGSETASPAASKAAGSKSAKTTD